MKVLRKIFSKKEENKAEKKIAANEKALKKRNIKRGVGAAIGVGLGAFTGKVAGDIAEGKARSIVFEKGAKNVGKKFIKAYEKIVEKAKQGNITEHEADFLREAPAKFANPVTFRSEARQISRNSHNIRKAADQVGKKARLGVSIAIGGGLAAHQIASTIKAAKEDRKKTDKKNERAIEKAKEKDFSKVSDITKKAVKSGIKTGKVSIKEFDREGFNNLRSAKNALISENKTDEKSKTFSGREKVSKSLLKKAKTSGVIQKDSSGNWRIISMKSGEFWDAKYETREKAEAALAAYHANRH